MYVDITTYEQSITHRMPPKQNQSEVNMVMHPESKPGSCIMHAVIRETKKKLMRTTSRHPGQAGIVRSIGARHTLRQTHGATTNVMHSSGRGITLLHMPP